MQSIAIVQTSPGSTRTSLCHHQGALTDSWDVASLCQSCADFLLSQHVYLSIHASLPMILLNIELELTSLWSLELHSHSQTHFKKSVTFVAFHDFYKGNLSNKLHSTVSSSAIPYLSCFTARGWMPSGLGDLLLFILLYFFFFLSKPASTRTWIWNYFSHLLTEKGELCRAFLGSSTESTDAKILFNFSDLSQMLHFHLAHQLAHGCSGRFPACDGFKRIWLLVFMTLI